LFRRLLVPLDGSAEAESALAITRNIATALGSQVWLLRTLPGGDVARDEISAGCAYLDRFAQQLAGAGIRVGTQVRTGPAADAILSGADLLSADLLVVAATCDAAPDILTRSRVPVVLVRPDAPDTGKLERLLVPMDDSVGAAMALGVAAELAQHNSAELVLLRVAEPIPPCTYDRGASVDLGAYVNPQWASAALDGAQRHVDGLARQLELDGLRVQARAALGGVLEAIVMTAEHGAVDMIVMGTPADRGPIGALPGSVADPVVQAVALPVLLVPTGVRYRTPGGPEWRSVAPSKAVALVRG
jgi:nucleotide-binding universal stress UspA family protein